VCVCVCVWLLIDKVPWNKIGNRRRLCGRRWANYMKRQRWYYREGEGERCWQWEGERVYDVKCSLWVMTQLAVPFKLHQSHYTPPVYNLLCTHIQLTHTHTDRELFSRLNSEIIIYLEV